jgi:cell division cycle 2-like protein
MPDEKTWPRFRYLPLAAKALQLLPAEHKRNRLRYFFPEEKLSFQVLQGLLTCNPDKRLTAAKALKLPWFNALRTAAAAKIDASVVVPPRKKTPRIKFIPPAEPAEKITFKIPLAMWNAERV